jgi:hypothetical protein
MRRTVGLAMLSVVLAGCGLLDKLGGKKEEAPEKVEEKAEPTATAESADTAEAAADETATPAASGDVAPDPSADATAVAAADGDAGAGGTATAATDATATVDADAPPDAGTASTPPPPSQYDGGIGTGTTPCLQRCQQTLRSCVGGGQGFDANRCHANFNACQAGCFR